MRTPRCARWCGLLLRLAWKLPTPHRRLGLDELHEVLAEHDGPQADLARLEIAGLDVPIEAGARDANELGRSLDVVSDGFNLSGHAQISSARGSARGRRLLCTTPVGDELGERRQFALWAPLSAHAPSRHRSHETMLDGPRRAA